MISGLPRNLATIAVALGQRERVAPQGSVRSWFRITPLDTGFSKLKSDRYLQLAESAQVDFLIRTGLMRTLLAGRVAFVNGAQLIRFARPVPMFSRVAVDTRVAWADAKWAWFSHRVSLRDTLCAEVLVKMKFKRGALTVAPAELLGDFAGAAPAFIAPWDATLAALADAAPQGTPRAG